MVALADAPRRADAIEVLRFNVLLRYYCGGCCCCCCGYRGNSYFYSSKLIETLTRQSHTSRPETPCLQQRPATEKKTSGHKNINHNCYALSTYLFRWWWWLLLLLLQRPNTCKSLNHYWFINNNTTIECWCEEKKRNIEIYYASIAGGRKIAC